MLKDVRFAVKLNKKYKICDQCNQCALALAKILTKTLLAILQKNQFGASATGICWKETKFAQISKTFIFKPFFSLWSRKKLTPNLGF